MLRTFLIIGFFCFHQFATFAIGYKAENYDWAEKPVLHKLTEEEEKASAILVKDYRILEYNYGEKENLFFYKTLHKIIRVTDDQAVERFNKVFVPMDALTQFVDLKARSITPDGKVRVLDKENIKELENVQEYGNFKIFAIEGVEKGGEVEYFYTTKSLVVSELYGREIIQTDTRTKACTIEIISPSNLVFDVKGYNGFEKFETSEDKETITVKGSLTDIPSLVEEQYCTYRANLMKVDYKLSYNKGGLSQSRLYSWSDASKKFGEIIYTENEAVSKPISKLAKSLKLKKLKGEDKIKAIEKYIKNNIAQERGSGVEYTDVAKILVNKYASGVGLARLYGAFFMELGIDNQLVVTTNRFQSRFDPKFESWNNFTELLFYFPKYDKYISPELIQYRFGFPPYQLAGNYGLFINADKKGEVKYLKMPSADDCVNRIDATVKFDKEFNTKVDIRHGWTGYRAAEFRAIYKFQDMEFINDRVTSGMEDAKIVDTKLHNESMEDSGDSKKEFFIESKLEVNTLLEKAGKNYLFKIGEIIGGQAELYQEHERQNPIDMPYPTYYKRNITFKIPEGYSLQGLEDLKIDESVSEEGELVNRFISDYTIEGNTVKVRADEYYHKVSLSKKNYEPFRKVINAAADFNKVVLVFEKDSDK